MPQTETQVGWQDYLAIILRRRWFFAVPCVAIVVLSLLVGMLMPRIYRAETIILVQEPNIMNPLIQGLAVSTSVGERLRTLREEILSWTSLSRLAHELKLNRSSANPVAFERLVKRLQRKIEVRLRGKDLVLISYEHEDPRLCQQLVNTVSGIFLERNTTEQTAEAETAISFLESEMAVYKKKLEDSELSLREFKELYVMQMPVATKLNEQIVELEINLARLLVDNTEEHPRVLETKRQIFDLKRKRNEEIKRVIVAAIAKGNYPQLYEDLAKALEETAVKEDQFDPTIRAARQAYQAWVNRLDSPAAQEQRPSPQLQVVASSPDGAGGSVGIIGASAPSLSLAPRQEQQLARLTRDYEVNADTYQHLQERLERAKITQRLGKSDEGLKFKILEPARLPLRPVKPNLLKIFCFAILLGMFVGAGSAFVAEYLDQSFQSAEEAQNALEIPVLGSISTIVTEEDLAAKRARWKSWLSYKDQLQRFNTYIAQPIWTRVDRALVRLGL